jgi:hypothetical protein
MLSISAFAVDFCTTVTISPAQMMLTTRGVVHGNQRSAG